MDQNVFRFYYRRWLYDRFPHIRKLTYISRKAHVAWEREDVMPSKDAEFKFPNGGDPNYRRYYRFYHRRRYRVNPLDRALTAVNREGMV